jgi:hypothetical protein
MAKVTFKAKTGGRALSKDKLCTAMLELPSNNLLTSTVGAGTYSPF